MIKRVLDTFFAFVAFVAVFPLLLLVSLFILSVERQNPIFIQSRVGRGKRSFFIYKLTTMSAGKITRIGGILRKTGIDELPQLINILKQEMSFVGPRPLTIDDVKRLEWDDEFHSKRWSVRPGIVGLAQLAPVCHKKMSWFYDQYYVAKGNLCLDMKIIFMAALVPFIGKEATKKRLHGKS